MICVLDEMTGGQWLCFIISRFLCSEKNMFSFMFVGVQRQLEGNHWIKVSLKMVELRVQVVIWYVWHQLLPPEGPYWIVMTLAPDGTAGRNPLDRDNFGSTWCSWEVDSGWRCHPAAACGPWICRPKPRHFTIFAHGISLVMHRHTNPYMHTLDGLQTHVSVILSSPLSAIILGWLPLLSRHPYAHPLPDTLVWKLLSSSGLEGTQLVKLVPSVLCYLWEINVWNFPSF